MTALLQVDGLSKVFSLPAGLLGLRRRELVAVDRVSFTLAPGEVLGLVGESGSGKTTLGRSVLRLVEPSAGSIRFDGQDVTGAGPDALRRLRRRMQIVFQDPYASLDPRKTVGGMLREALAIHRMPASRARVEEIVDMVGLSGDYLSRYPHEFSGGQRQRIGIARALAVGPEFIVADEPVSALDVSIQAQIINLLVDLKARLHLAMLFIGHDLAVIRHVSDRVMVLYLGRVMEIAPVRRLYESPRHPYTEALLSAAPQVDRGGRQRILLRGEQPSPANPPSGCVFRTRCPYALPECAEHRPPLEEVAPGHFRACIRADVPGSATGNRTD